MLRRWGPRQCEAACAIRRFNSCARSKVTKTVQSEKQLLSKLQALVYDILPSTTAVFSYAIGSRKLSANEQFFFVGAQTVVSVLQTTQIISDICFITDHVAYASSYKTKIVGIETELYFFTRGGCASCLRACWGAMLLVQSY